MSKAKLCNGMVVHVSSREENNKFLEMLEGLVDGINDFYDIYKDQTCYEIDDWYLYYSDVNYYESEGIEIYDFEDVEL